MKNTAKTLYLSGLTLAAVSSVLLRTNIIGFNTVSPVFAQAEDKIVICHADGLDGTLKFSTLELAYNAVYSPGNGGHFNENGTPKAGHENDYFGACITVTPTPTPTSGVTPTPTPTSGVTPSPTPTSTPEPTATPTQEPTSTPTPGQSDNSSTSTNSSTTQESGQVLASSTTLAKTGVAQDLLFNLFGLLGSSFVGLSFKKRK